MIIISDEDLDEMAVRIRESEAQDNPYEPEAVYPLSVYRKALETWLAQMVDGMMQDVVSLAFGPYSKGAYRDDVRREAKALGA